MAVPTISPVTSILGFKQYDPWTFQMYATNSPTSWTLRGQPTGITIDNAGRVSGAALESGVFNAVATATNGDGNSAELTFPIGIEYVAYAPNSAINLVWNTQTGELAVLDSSGATTSPADGSDLPLFQAKLGDDMLFFIRLWNGTYLDLPLTGLRFSIKEKDTEKRVVLSTEGFLKRGVGPQTYYILHAKFDGNALKGALSNYDDDAGTKFAALGEFERTETNLVYGELGPATLVRSSRTILVDTERDITQ